VAVRAPFSKAAEGVRLPDGNPNLTSTLVLTQKYQIAADANGDLDAVIMPNLYCHSVSPRGSISTTNKVRLANPTNTANTIANAVLGAANGLGFDVNTLSGQYTRYRVASYGMRLRTTQGVSGAGEFTVAVLPCVGQTPYLDSSWPAATDGNGAIVGSISYWGSAGPRSQLGEWMYSMGIPTTSQDNSAVVDVAKLVNAPSHAVASASQVAARGLHVRGLPFESRVRDFRTTRFNAYGTDSWDMAMHAGNAAGATYASQQFGVDMSFGRVDGTEYHSGRNRVSRVRTGGYYRGYLPHRGDTESPICCALPTDFTGATCRVQSDP
jgi:hypothetical protein